MKKILLPILSLFPPLLTDQISAKTCLERLSGPLGVRDQYSYVLDCAKDRALAFGDRRHRHNTSIDKLCFGIHRKGGSNFVSTWYTTLSYDSSEPRTSSINLLVSDKHGKTGWGERLVDNERRLIVSYGATSDLNANAAFNYETIVNLEDLSLTHNYYQHKFPFYRDLQNSTRYFCEVEVDYR